MFEEKPPAPIAEPPADSVTLWLAAYREKIKKERQKTSDPETAQLVALPRDCLNGDPQVELTFFNDDRTFCGVHAKHCHLHGFKPLIRRIWRDGKNWYRAECGFDIETRTGPSAKCPNTQVDFFETNRKALEVWNLTIALSAP
jgi:hypothetical protein